MIGELAALSEVREEPREGKPPKPYRIVNPQTLVVRASTLEEIAASEPNLTVAGLVVRMREEPIVEQAPPTLDPCRKGHLPNVRGVECVRCGRSIANGKVA